MWGRVRRRVWIGAGILGLAVVLPGLALVSTDVGARLIVGMALPRVTAGFDGAITVRDVRTHGLWHDLTLLGVRVSDAEGTEAISMDSVSIAYRLGDLLRSRIHLRSVALRGARVSISTLPGQERSNLERIFAPGRNGLDPDSVRRRPARLEVSIGDAIVEDVDLIVRLPAGPEADSTTQVLERTPGGFVRRIEISDLGANLSDARLVAPDQSGRLEVQNLRAEVRFYPTSFIVHDLTGSVARVASTASLDGSLAVGGSSFEGAISVDWGGGLLGYDVALESDRFDPSDFAFVDPRLPVAVGRGRISAVSDGETARYALTEATLATGSGRIRGDVGIQTDTVGIRRLDGVDLDLTALDLSVLGDWLDDVAPPPLSLSGRVAMDGALERLSLAATLEVASSEGRFEPSTLELDGILRLSESFGASRLSIEAPRLDMALPRTFWPDLPLRGSGSLSGTVRGTVSGALDLDVEVRHRLTAEHTSRVRYVGVVDNGSTLPRLDGTAFLAPLYLGSLAQVSEVFAVEEAASGTLALSGPLDALEVTADLESSLGGVSGTVRVDGVDPTAGYAADLTLNAFDPHSFVPSLDCTSLSGRVVAELAGASPREIAGSVRADLTPSKVRGVALDSAHFVSRFEGGYATLDSSSVWMAGSRALAVGTVGLLEDEPPGRLEVDLRLPSLEAVSARMAGAHPAGAGDGEPDQEEASGRTLAGSVNAAATVRVAGSRLEGGGRLLGRDLEVGFLEADSVLVEFDAVDAPGGNRTLSLSAVTRPLSVFGRPFDAAELHLDWTPDSTGFALEAVRGDSVRHRHVGWVRTVGGSETLELTLDSADLSLDGRRIALTAPATLSWGPGGFSVDRAEFTFAGDPTRRIVVEGTLPTEGEARFSMDAAGLDLSTASAVLSLPERLAGIVDAGVTVSGPVAAPLVQARLDVLDLVFRDESLPELRASAEYADQVLAITLAGVDSGRTVLDADVAIPSDLSARASDRFPPRPLSGSVSFRDFPLALVATLPGVVEDVDGSIVGDLDLGGPVTNPQIIGSLQISGGALLLPTLGVRHGTEGTLTLSRGGRVGLELVFRNHGTARVDGTVDLTDLTRPGFDLTATADSFRVVDRRDVSANVSGPLRLRGDWQRPIISGDLTTRGATLRLDALANRRGIENVTPEDFYRVVDTTVFALGISDAPSMVDRAEIDMGIRLGAGNWLRSRDINAELTGGFRLLHEPLGEFALNGELRTVRGSYTGFGKTFQVVEGSVLFAGSRSFDPILNITTVTRVRSSTQALDIQATLQGTATAPTVELSSNAQPPMAEEELVSYLVFGRPSYQLGSGEDAVLAGVTGAASSLFLGSVASELGAALGGSLNVFDYFTISAPQEVAQYGQGHAMRSSIASTQVDVGQYLSDNLFLAATLRPLDTNSFAGARLEWRFENGTTVEVFLEDRLARSPSATFGDLGFTLEQSLGMFLAREWIY